MSRKPYGTPVVKLAKAIVGKYGFWTIAATAPDDLVAVQITVTGVRDLLAAETTDFAELETLLINSLPRLELFVASLKWAAGRTITA